MSSALNPTMSYFITKNYVQEHDTSSVPTETHPLLGSSASTAIKGGSTVADPLRKGGATDPLTGLMEGSDPLSLMAATDAAIAPLEEEEKAAAAAREEAARGDWPTWRRAVLAQFTTSQLVTVCTRAGDAADTVAVGTTSRAKVRLAQLEPARDDVTGRDQLTQHEFVAHINRMKKQLQEAWQADQRVKALKIVIQACKMLEDVSLAQFYPSLFVLVTDMLDVFGGLVYTRVVSKDADKTPGGDQVSESGRETCRNWFYKVSSIRELLARLYVEMAILKCYDLLETGGAEAAASRLVSAIRGVGAPLAAGYARAYLAKVAPPTAQVANLEDFIAGLSPRAVAPSWRRPSLVSPSVKDDNSPPAPPLGPALEWCLRRAVCACAVGKRDTWLEELQEQNGGTGSSLVLMALLRSAGPEHLSARAIQYVQAVDACSDSAYRRCDLLDWLGRQLTLGEVPEGDRLHALNTAWRQLQELTSAAEYVACAPAWCGYVAKYFGPRQLAVVLRDAVDHLSPDRQFEQHYPQLEKLLMAAVGDGAQLTQLAKIASFGSALELLQEERVRTRVHRRLLELLLQGEAELPAETALAELGLRCCQVVHDSVSMLSLDDERREASVLICRFLRRAWDPAQLESSLDLLVQARGSFYNLEAVTVYLISAVHHLAAMARSSGSRRRRSFSAACIAYCFITLPALDDVMLKLKLYVVTAQVALASGCLGQADACVRAAVTGLPDIPAQLGPTERSKPALPPTLELVKNLLSTLLIFPDQPSQPPLYLVSGLLAALDRVPWLQGTDPLARLYLDVLRLLCALSQPRYLYSVPGVDANDTLYGGDEQLTKAVASLTEDVIGRLTSHLHLDSQSPLSRPQVSLAVELCLFLLKSGELRNPAVSSTAGRLLSCLKSSDAVSPQQRADLSAAAEARGGVRKALSAS